MAIQFEIEAVDPLTSARVGRLTTPHGDVATPVFMPVGTQGTVKTLAPRDLREAGAELVLANTYHLYLRPGPGVVREAGGLAAFSGWYGPTLTDSGGYQLFSMKDLARVKPDGVTFHSHIDGSLHFFSPEKVIDLGFDIRPDIMMVLDECTAYPATRDEARASLELTCQWAGRARARHRELTASFEPAEHDAAPAPFAVLQGGVYADLRAECAARLVELDFPGYGIGGLGVGEPAPEREEMTAVATRLLPADRPRYLMGVGYPEDILAAVASGVDLFDCVLPTRNGRSGWLYTSRGRVVVKNAAYARDFRPPDENCGCPTCRTVTRAYLRHLFNAGEMLAPRLASHHNVHFFLTLMANIRKAIRSGVFDSFRREFMALYGSSRVEAPG